MKIGIAGVGGVGSNVARLLAQSTVGGRVESPFHLHALSLVLVDHDDVEAGNLNRQFYGRSQTGLPKAEQLKVNLEEISPHLEIQTRVQKLGPGDATALFKDCDLVVEGFDQAGLKKMILEEMAVAGTPMVSASGIAGCDLDGVGVRKLGRTWIVGDFTSDQDTAPLFPPKVALVTARMAALVLEHLCTQLPDPAYPQKGRIPSL